MILVVTTSVLLLLLEGRHVDGMNGVGRGTRRVAAADAGALVFALLLVF